MLLININTRAIPKAPDKLAAGNANTGTSKLQAIKTNTVVKVSPSTSNPKTARQPSPIICPVSFLLIF